MNALIFSDIHGNLPAFESMLKNEKYIDLYVSLGDVVNYGPWSNECVDRLESLQSVKLRGNHEDYFLNGAYGGKTQLVNAFFTKCMESFARLDAIGKYVNEFELGQFTCRHTINDAYVHPDTPIEITGNYFIGHSHSQFDRKDAGYHVINVGSVGQNRREINVINYAVYETETCHIELKSLVYDIAPVIRKMKELKYPEECILYYLNKPKRS
jgi:predicted phosphodiesterase